MMIVVMSTCRAHAESHRGSQQLVTVGVVIATRFEPVKWFMMDHLTSCVANPLNW